MTVNTPEKNKYTGLLKIYAGAIKNIPLLKYSWVLIATICILAFTAYLQLKNTDVFLYALAVILVSFVAFLFSYFLKTKEYFVRFLIHSLLVCIVATSCTAVLGFGTFIIWQKPKFYSRWFPDHSSLEYIPSEYIPEAKSNPENINSNVELRGEERFTRKISNNDDKFIIGSDNEVLYGKGHIPTERGLYKDEELKLNYKSKNTPNILRIGVDHPIGYRVITYSDTYKDKSYGVTIPFEFSIGVDGRELEEGYYFQVCEHDFENDGDPEVVIGIRSIDLAGEMQINVFKFHPPIEIKDFMRQENWELIGKFEGAYPFKAFLEDASIQIAFGSQGLFSEYSLFNGKFVKTTDY